MAMALNALTFIDTSNLVHGCVHFNPQTEGCKDK